jgi:FimV-like protein
MTTTDTREALIELLRRYSPPTEDRASDVRRIVSFVEREPACAERSHQFGHLTGSAWIVNTTRTKALLLHHRKLNRWMQPGGHADGDLDLLAVALREAREESGLSGIEPVTLSEVGTKLDLARAYMDMGDPEGARNILAEVVAEGSPGQQQEAKRLLGSLPG